MQIKEQFRLGMRRLPSGVSVVATVDEGGPKGFLATSVSSVALEPSPCLLVCVNKSISSHDALLKTGIFAVSLLGHRDTAIARQFSSSALRDERFKSGSWVSLVTGAPVYRDALTAFDCEFMTSMSVQTHTILVGKVVDVRLPPEKIDPLIYLNGAFSQARWSCPAN